MTKKVDFYLLEVYEKEGKERSNWCSSEVGENAKEESTRRA
jgi:hypothetical protein